MNNARLLTGLLVAILLSGKVCAGQTERRIITLDEIFATAEAASSQLKPSFTAEKEAEKGISIARDNRLPEIELSVSLGYIGDGFTTKRNFSDYQKATIPHFYNGLTIGITQPVYTGGAVTGGIEIAELKSTATRYATDFRRDNIRFQLTGFYLDIYKYTNLRTVINNNIRQAREVLTEMTARHEQGTALKNDIIRYELLLSNLELHKTKIDNTLDILNRNLTTIAGLPEGTIVIPDSTILSRSLPIEDEHWWQEEAATHSPTLKLAELEVDINRKAEAIARSEHLPKIGLQAGWTLEGPILVEVPPINRNLSYWQVGIGISYNLASLYKSNKTITKSKLSTRKAIEESAATYENLSLAVRSDYIRYLEAYEDLKTQQKSVELADINYSIVLTRYEAEMALITDILEAANSKLDAEQQLVNAQINIIYYYYKLLFTSGKI